MIGNIRVVFGRDKRQKILFYYLFFYIFLFPAFGRFIQYFTDTFIQIFLCRLFADVAPISVKSVTLIAYVTGVVRALAFAEKVVVKRFVAHAPYKFSDCRQIFRMLSELVHHGFAQQLFTPEHGIKFYCGIQFFRRKQYIRPFQRIILIFLFLSVFCVRKANAHRFIVFVLNRVLFVFYA